MPSIYTLNDMKKIATEVINDNSTNEFIGDFISPPVQVTDQAAYLESFDRKQNARRPQDVRRAPGGKSNTTAFDVDRSLHYYCTDHSKALGMPYEVTANKNTSVKLSKYVSAMVDVVRQAKEIEIWAKVTSSGCPTSIPTYSWDDPTNGVPLKNALDTAVTSISNYGFIPNSWASSIRVARAMFSSKQGVELQKYKGEVGVIAYKQLIADYLGFKPENIHLSEQDAINISQDGEDAVLSGLYSDSVLIYQKGTDTGGFMVQPVWSLGELQDGSSTDENGWRMSEWQDPESDSKKFAIHAYFDPGVVLNQKAAYLFTDVIHA